MDLLLVGDAPEPLRFANPDGGDGLPVTLACFGQRVDLARMWPAGDAFIFPVLANPHRLAVDESMATRLRIISSTAVGSTTAWGKIYVHAAPVRTKSATTHRREFSSERHGNRCCVTRRNSVLAVAAVAGLAIPLFVSQPGLQNLTAMMILFTATLAAVPIVPLVFGRAFDIFEPVYIFAASFAVLFVVKPLWDLSQPGGVPSFAGESPVATYPAALAVAALGAAGFYVAYYSRRPPSEAATFGRGEQVAISARLNAFVIGLVVLAAALYGALIVTSWRAGAQPSGYLSSGPLLLAPAGLLLLLASPKWRSRRGIVGVSLVILSQVPAVVGGARSWTLPVLAALALLFYLKHRSRPRFAWIALLSMPVFLLFVSAPRDYRGLPANQGSLVESVWSTVADPGIAIDRFFRVGDTSMAPDLAIELRFVPGVLDYQFGVTYVEALMRPIPRAWWPGKPQSADSQLMAVIWPTYYDQQVGFAFSAFGEPYLNFGIAGVAVFGLVVGVMCRALYSWIARRPASQLAQAVFAVSWPFVFVYMRGGIGVDYQRQFIILVPLLVGYKFGWRDVPADRPIGQRQGAESPRLAHRDAAPCRPTRHG